jgi:hypothetical protein
VSIDWDRGPIASLLGDRQQQQPSAGSGAMMGARYGMAAGPLGAALGAGIGAFAGWLQSRSWSNQLASMANDRAQPDTGAGVGWNVDLGDPQSSAQRMGPPSNLAGTLGQLQDDGSPWYADTTMNADDPMGLVPDYGQDGPDENGDGRITPGERRDAAQGGYSIGGKFAGTPFGGSVTNMIANGGQVILGSGDPSGRYRNRGTDYGG